MPLASNMGSVWSGVSYLNPTYLFFAMSTQDKYTFSNLSLIGGGFIVVMVSAISYPILNACSLVLPLRYMNTESVSPYTTLAPHFSVPSMTAMAWITETTWVSRTAWDSSMTHLFKRLPTALDNAVSNLHRRHPPRVRRTCIPVRHIGDILEPELPGIQYPTQCLERL